MKKIKNILKIINTTLLLIGVCFIGIVSFRDINKDNEIKVNVEDVNGILQKIINNEKGQYVGYISSSNHTMGLSLVNDVLNKDFYYDDWYIDTNGNGEISALNDKEIEVLLVSTQYIIDHILGEE